MRKIIWIAFVVCSAFGAAVFGAAEYRNSQYGFSLNFGPADGPLFGMSSRSGSGRVFVALLGAWKHPRICYISAKTASSVYMYAPFVEHHYLGSIIITAGRGMPGSRIAGRVLIDWLNPNQQTTTFYSANAPLWFPTLLFSLPPLLFVTNLVRRAIRTRRSAPGGFFVVAKPPDSEPVVL